MSATVFRFGDDSTALETYGNVTLINDYLATPNRRGENQMIPFRHGRVYVPKFYEERVMTFGILASAADGAALEASLNTMRAKFAPLRQQPLSMTMEDSTVLTALASVDRAISVQRLGPGIAKIAVEFKLTQPFFRLSTPIADNTTVISASPTSMTVTNPGTVEERDPIITISDAHAGHLRILNTTNGTELNWYGETIAGESVVIQTVNGEYVAVRSPGGTNMIGDVYHTGSAALLVINVGANALSVTPDSGTPSLKISFNAPFA